MTSLDVVVFLWSSSGHLWTSFDDVFGRLSMTSSDVVQ